MNDAGQTVCLCMIVKDEAPVIARCLRSVRPFIDAWAIVDTGSTDGTQAIVRERLAGLPGELIERFWVDFAHNRTEAVEHARGRASYILVIDADEALEADEEFRLPELSLDSYDLEVSYDGVVYQRRQLLRDGLDWCYRGVLHEYLHSDAARSAGRIEGLRTIVRHDGARSRDPLTYRRDALVLEQALLDEPDNPRYAFYLGQSYRDAGEYEAAIRAYRRRIALGGWPEEVWFSLYQIAAIEECLGRPWPEVMASYLAAYAAAPGRAEPLFRIGVHYQAAGQHHLAYLFFSRAVAIPTPGPDRLFVERAVYDFLLPIEYAVAAHYTGDFVGAIDTNNALLRSSKLPPQAAGQVICNRRFSLDALHPRIPAEAPPRIKVVMIVRDPGSELEDAVDGALRQEDAECQIIVIDAGSSVPLADRLPTHPRLQVIGDTTLEQFLANRCAPEDVVIPLPARGALASRQTARAVVEAFADKGCLLLHGPHRQERASSPPIQPPSTEGAFRLLASALGDGTSLCFRASLAHATRDTTADVLWNAASFAGTRSLDQPLTAQVAPPRAQVSARAAVARDGERAGRSEKVARGTAAGQNPSISCLMVTRDRLSLARLAIRCFADQTYSRRQLVIVSEGDRWYRDALKRCARELEIEHFEVVAADPSVPLGGLRNISLDAADGEVVCQWDDDDLCHPARLATQLDGMLRAKADSCFLTDHIQYLEREQLAFWIDWTGGGRVSEELQLFPGTVMLYKDPEFRYPEDGPYARHGEDSVLVSHLFHTRSVARLPGMGHLYLYRYHGSNTFDQAHHMRITSCCAPNDEIRPFAGRIREALTYYPVPKPVVVLGSDGPVMTVT
jgi:glycosyltransferase involved in cell wall biosynthesis